MQIKRDITSKVRQTSGGCGHPPRGKKVMTMYEECLQALGKYRELSEENSRKIIDSITENIEFKWYDNINWDKIKNKKEIISFNQLNNLKDRDVYLFGDNGEYPVLIATLKNIINCWDDVEALGTKIWVVSIEMDFFLEYQHEKLLLGFKNE